MRTKLLPFALILALLTSPVFIMGCGEDDDEDSGHAAHAFLIELEPPGHVHTFRESELIFRVSDESGAPVTGLLPIVARQFQDAEEARETSEGDVVGNGDGTYTWLRTFTDAGVYVITFKFEEDGGIYSQAFPLPTSKAGGERIYCPDADDPEHAYQIRWEVTPGHVHAGAEAIFSIELKRSINDEVNTEQPWTNTFDQLTPDDMKPAGSLPEIFIGSHHGDEETDVVYKGGGIYEATLTFEEHMEEKETFWLHVVFEDECGTVDESGEEEADFQFSVSPVH